MHVCLPRDEREPGARADQLNASRDKYRWAYDWPVGVATAASLPRDENYPARYVLSTFKTYAEIGVNLGLMTLEGWEQGDLAEVVKTRFESLDRDTLREHIFKAPKELLESLPPLRVSSWESYEAMFQIWPKPPIVDAFHGAPADLDRAFAWQRVAGVNPMILARCQGVPANLAVDEALYQRVMSGDSLARATAEGRLYIADYAAFDGLEAGTTDGLRKYISAPIALFAVDAASGELRPVAIQCGQVPSKANPVVCPAERWRWRMAMMLVQIADANYHEGVAHLGRTHMVMEAVKIAMERQLARCHPLFALLTPHLETTLAINESAKTSLIASGGTVDRCFALKIEAFGGVVQKMVSTYRLDQTAPAQDLAARGLSDRAALPAHPYRDDALLVWDALARFIESYVALYYATDADVLGDTELQAFVAELSAADGGRLAGVPPARTIAELGFLLTRLVFIAGPQHSAVNFPQFPLMGFPANMAGASYAPQMSADTPDTEEGLTAMLPDWKIALESSVMVYLLSNVRESTFGDYGLLHFADLRVLPLVRAFQRDLQEVEAKIVAADAGRLMSYPWLRPSQILQSISI